MLRLRLSLALRRARSAHGPAVSRPLSTSPTTSVVEGLFLPNANSLSAPGAAPPVPLARGEGPIGVVLAPARELAKQHAENIAFFSEHLEAGGLPPLRVLSLSLQLGAEGGCQLCGSALFAAASSSSQPQN
jgi:hypothetical protein